MYPAENIEAFEQQAKAIQGYISAINTAVGEIKYFNKVLKNELNTDKINEIKSKQVDPLVNNTNAYIAFARDGLAMLHRSKRGDKVYRKEVYVNYAQSLQRAIKEFVAVQNEAKTANKIEFSRQYKVIKPDATQVEIDAALESGGSDVFAVSVISGNIAEKQAVLSAVQTRQKEILKLSASLTELVDLMEQMNTLINNQQEMIDLIDDHVTEAAYDIEAGSKEVGLANNHILNARKTKWTIMWIVLAIVLVIILAIRDLIIVYINRIDVSIEQIRQLNVRALQEVNQNTAATIDSGRTDIFNEVMLSSRVSDKQGVLGAVQDRPKELAKNQRDMIDETEAHVVNTITS
ncbi:Plasma membrane t-SNARE, secretory vesicle fusion [Physocladia obscura]|uniref:Plasma membrane t-SNARE, secretory vesicle fusion n=1 Tax=Physocladia obscura TaxID=109957 RepID=A0AAD5TA70_9FUNG|nr:Plasma membrane t-SNARE, secretory vesicle fusion [Physocladia obscura]